MKQLFLIAISFFMIACEPQDNKLSTPTRTGAAGQQSAGSTQSLRVGSYGLPILTAQTFEKMGSLVHDCLFSIQNGEIVSSESDDVLRFSCDRSQQREYTKGAVTHVMSEDWNVIFRFPSNAASFDLKSLKSAKGVLKRGIQFGKFKYEVLKTTHSADQFQILNQDGVLLFRMAQIFEVGTARDTYFMTHNAVGKIQIEESKWKFNFDAQYKYLNQSQSYQLNSNNLDLLWKSDKCADFNGDTSVQDKQANLIIRLQGDSARLVTSNRPWQQSLESCVVREFNIQNFDFIFF